MIAGEAAPAAPPLARRVAIVVGIVVAGAMITAGFLWNNRQSAQDRGDAYAEEVLDDASARLQRTIDRSDEMVTSVANMVMAFGVPQLDGAGVTAEQFGDFVDHRLADHPEFQAVQYQHLVDAEDRGSFEQLMAARGLDQGIVEPSEDGPVPAGERGEYLAILYNRPDQPNRAAFGLDVLARPEVAELVWDIAGSGELGVTESVAIVQGDGETFAMPMYRPVYDPSMPLDTEAQRVAAFRGMAAAVLLHPQMIEASLRSAADELNVVVLDTVGGEQAPIAELREGELHDQAGLAVASSASDDRMDPGRFPVSEEVSLGGRDLLLLGEARAAVVSGFEQPAGVVILVAGILLTAMAAAAWWRWSQARRLRRVAESLIEANKQLDLSATKMTELARTDVLTGASNLSHLRERVGERVESGLPTSLVLVDLDRFKVINDSVGHRHGDELLRGVGARLRSLAAPGDLVARIGGDEFALLCDPSPDGEPRAEQLLAHLARPFRVGDRVLHLAATLGVCSFPDDAPTAADVMLRAEMALHEAKRASRGNWLSYDAWMAERAGRREWLERELRAALERDDGSLETYYQCRVDLSSGVIVGAEALARWTHPQQGPVPPSEFVPVAEETGLILKLGERVLRDACTVLRRALDAGVPLRSMAVNVTGQQLRSTSFSRVVRAHLDRCELSATSLVAEITETVAMDDRVGDRTVVDQLEALRDMGVVISIDDFGTGHSSLSRLANLPLQELKIDRSFVAGLPGNSTHTGIVKAILAMAQHMGLIVVAEGVETTDQLTWLRSHGCQEAQGWLFSRAVPAPRFLEQLRPTEGPPEHWPQVGRAVTERLARENPPARP